MVILSYRIAAFVLAVGYFFYVVATASYNGFAGPLRYLTVWSLVMSIASFWYLIKQSRFDDAPRREGFIAANAIIAAMVVLLYWRLYFADPTSVTRDGQLANFWLEAYLHAAGPALLWIDALFFHRGFQRIATGLTWLVGTIAAYLSWTEFVIQPLSAVPEGTVTSGLPYPFLNNMELGERLVFYGVNFATAVVLFLAFAAVAWVIRRLI